MVGNIKSEDPILKGLKAFSNRWLVLQKALSIKEATRGKSRSKLERYYTVEALRLFGKKPAPEVIEALKGIFKADKEWISRYFGEGGATLDDIRNAMQESFGIKGLVIGTVTIPNPNPDPDQVANITPSPVVEVAVVPVPAPFAKDTEFSEEELKLFISLMASISISALSLEQNTKMTETLFRRLQFQGLSVSQEKAAKFLKYIKTCFKEFFPDEDDVPF